MRVTYPYPTIFQFSLCNESTVHWVINIHVPEGARAALNLSGTVLGYYPVRVLPSKTAIAPVNPTFLPRVCNLQESTCLS